MRTGVLKDQSLTHTIDVFHRFLQNQVTILIFVAVAVGLSLMEFRSDYETVPLVQRMAFHLFGTATYYVLIYLFLPLVFHLGLRLRLAPYWVIVGFLTLLNLVEAHVAHIYLLPDQSHRAYWGYVVFNGVSHMVGALAFVIAFRRQTRREFGVDPVRTILPGSRS